VPSKQRQAIVHTVGYTVRHFPTFGSEKWSREDTFTFGNNSGSPPSCDDPFWQWSVASPSEVFDWQVRYLDIYLFSVCGHHWRALQTRLNRSRRRLGCGLGCVQGTMYSVGVPSPDPSTGRGNLFLGGLFSPSKCLRLHKQRTPQQHGAADMSTGDSISRRKCAALEWTHPLRGRCGLLSALFDQLLMACEDVNKSSLSSAAAAGGGGAIYRCRLCLYASDKVRSLLHSTHSLSLYFALDKLSS